MQYLKDNHKLYERVIMLLIIISPLIDLLNGLFESVFKINISPGVIIRTGLLVVIIVLYMKQRKINIIFSLFIFILFLIQVLILMNIETVNLLSDISFVSKIYYNVFILFILLNMVKRRGLEINRYINLLVIVCFIVIGSLIFTKVLGIGESSYGDAGGYKGLYIGLNDLTAVITMTYPFVILKMVKERKNKKYIFVAILASLNIIMIGTKTSIALLVLVALFFGYNILFKEKNLKNIILIILIFIIFIFVFDKYLLDIFKDTILERQIYFIKEHNFISYLLSQRNMTVIKSFDFWISRPIYILFGTGFTNGATFIGTFLQGHGMIEMDFIDIIYFYGIIFFMIVAVPLVRALFRAIKILFKSKVLRDKTIGFVYILGFGISFLGGHVILSPLAGIYFMLLCAMVDQISEVMKNEKKSISSRSE